MTDSKDLSDNQKNNIFKFAMGISRLHAEGGSAKATPDEVLKDTFKTTCDLCKEFNIKIFDHDLKPQN